MNLIETCIHTCMHQTACISVYPDGTVRGQKESPAVSRELLVEVLSWKAGAQDIDIINRLRQRTVPAGYVCHTWIPGMEYIVYI